jgi:hypothetical protein
MPPWGFALLIALFAALPAYLALLAAVLVLVGGRLARRAGMYARYSVSDQQRFSLLVTFVAALAALAWTVQFLAAALVLAAGFTLTELIGRVVTMPASLVPRFDPRFRRRSRAVLFALFAVVLLRMLWPPQHYSHPPLDAKGLAVASAYAKAWSRDDAATLRRLNGAKGGLVTRVPLQPDGLWASRQRNSVTSHDNVTYDFWRAGPGGCETEIIQLTLGTSHGNWKVVDTVVEASNVSTLPCR